MILMVLFFNKGDCPMKKIFIFCTFMMGAGNALAAVTMCDHTVSCPKGTGLCLMYSGFIGCRENYWDEFYVNDYGFYSCRECESGYTLKIKNMTLTQKGIDCNVTYSECERDCAGCTNCVSDVSWSANGTGYEKKTTRTCDCNTCNATTYYRCAAGYWGVSKDGISGCKACPDSGTSAPGSKMQTECYLSAGGSRTDATGTYKFTSDCYYSN